jgi:aminoglycoside 6'-N-acetyltransferase
MGLAVMSSITLRLATEADIPVREKWDRDPTVIAATTDDPDAAVAFEDDHDWLAELDLFEPDVWEYWIAELILPDGSRRPIGAMQMIDPHREPTHYWGDVGPGLRALDIWIGEPDARGQGHGETMMKLAFERCFSNPAVTAIVIDPLASNTRAHRFYQRIGFKPVGRQTFNDGEDDCLVHRLERKDWEAARGGA